MSDRRQTLFDSVITRLKTIVSAAAAYETNIGSQVFAWRDTTTNPFTEVELATGALNVRDPRHVVEQGGPAVIGKHHHTLSINVEGAVALGTEAAQVRKMMADITKAIGVDRHWSGIAYDTAPGEDQILVAQNGTAITGFSYNFSIEFRTGNYDPYNA